MIIVSEQDEEKPPETFKKQNKRVSFPVSLTVVALVYTLQGASLEFLQYSVQTDLIIKGASNSDLALLSSMEYPWCMKVLWAPLQDAFFFSSVGRRKTWVLGTLLLLSISWGLLSFRIMELVDNLNIWLLTLAGIVTSVLLTQQDVSMDGWIVKLSENDRQMSNFSWWCSFGYSLGGLLSFSLYIWLSSTDVCSEYFGIDHAILDSRQVVTAISVCFLLVTFLCALIPESKDAMEVSLKPSLIHPGTNLFGTEINRLPQLNNDRSEPTFMDDDEPKNVSNIMRVLKKISLVIYNKNILFLAVYLFFSEIGFSYFDNVGYVEMLSNGASEETYALFWLISTICEGITGFTVARFCAGRQMKIYIMSYFVRIFVSLLYTLIIIGLDYDYISENTGLIIYGVQLAITEIAYAMTTIPLMSFFMSVCDTEVEGTYIAFLTSILYAAPVWTATIVYMLSDYINGYIFIAGSLTYAVLYIALFYRKLTTLQGLPMESWKLKKNQ